MLYIGMNTIKNALNEGLSIEELLKALLMGDNILVYDEEKEKVIYEIFSFEDIQGFIDIIDTDTMDTDTMDTDTMDTMDKVILIFSFKWYYREEAGITHFIVYKLYENKEYNYKISIITETNDARNKRVEHQYFKNEKELLNRLKWAHVGTVLYVEYVDYETPSVIKEWLEDDWAIQNGWIKYSY